MKRTAKRLKQVYSSADVISFDSKSKFIIMSDCHRGQGNGGDNYLPNRTLHFAALEYYYKNGFCYIELGDGDELWENRNIYSIIEAHKDIFEVMSKFYSEERLHILFGNHDIVKRRKRLLNSIYKDFYCESEECAAPLFPWLEIEEGLVLEEKDTKNRILLAHGHQGNFLNDTIWPVARFLVRYVWKPLELVGFTAPTGAARSHNKKELIEKKLTAYANSNGIMLIAGHTHRPMYPEPGQSMYFNDGSCVHPGGITGIEIENGEITLVKWSVTAAENSALYVNRQILKGPNKIADYFK